jgi:hypothetical protein
MISQTLKDNSEVFGMFFLAFEIDENIIDKDHDDGSWSGWRTTTESIMDGLPWCFCFR